MGRTEMRPLANMSGQNAAAGSIIIDHVTQVYGTGDNEVLAVSDVSF